MARGKDPGNDFDDQWYASRRRAEYKKSRGEGVWADDAKLKRAGQPRPSHSADSEGCSKETMLLLGFLSGFGWVLNEVIRYVA